jgi:hypothetical protein
MSVARRDWVEHTHSRIALLRDRHRGCSLVLSSVGSVAWATGGLSIPINRVASVDPTWVVVDDDVTTLVASSVEVPRLRADDELDDLGFSIESALWHEPDAWRDHFKVGPIGCAQREFELSPAAPRSRTRSSSTMRGRSARPILVTGHDLAATIPVPRFS